MNGQHGSDFSPIAVEFSAIVPSSDFPRGRARCLMKELSCGNVENHRDLSGGKLFSDTEREKGKKRERERKRDGESERMRVAGTRRRGR